MSIFNKAAAVLLAVAFVFGIIGFTKAATTTVGLGTAGSFAVLAGSTVTNTGSSVLTGDLGLSPGSSVTGFPPGTVSGTQHVADATAVQAKTDLVTAYNDAAGRATTSTISADLGGRTLTPGVYTSASSIGLTGTLTLDGGGSADAVFIFKAGSTLTTASASSVVLTNGTQACNVFWQVGSSATLGTNSTFKGNILALASATLTTGANVQGSVLARNGAVTLDTNTVTRAVCAASTNTNTAVTTNTNTAVTTNTNTTVATNTNAAATTNANTNTAVNTNTAAAANTNATVATPKLPSTGVGPEAKGNIPWQLPASLVAGALVIAFTGRKQLFSRR